MENETKCKGWRREKGTEDNINMRPCENLIPCPIHSQTNMENKCCEKCRGFEYEDYASGNENQIEVCKNPNCPCHAQNKTLCPFVMSKDKPETWENVVDEMLFQLLKKWDLVQATWRNIPTNNLGKPDFKKEKDIVHNLLQSERSRILTKERAEHLDDIRIAREGERNRIKEVLEGMQSGLDPSHGGYDYAYYKALSDAITKLGL